MTPGAAGSSCPSSWTYWGLDYPIYTNTQVPWQEDNTSSDTAPLAPVNDNPVGMYRKTFTLDEGLSTLNEMNGRLYLNFQGVEAAYRSTIRQRSRYCLSCLNAIYVTPPVQGPTRERRTLHPVPRGGFHKAGGRPRLWWVFGDFLPTQKVTPAERSRLGRWSAPETSEKNRPPAKWAEQATAPTTAEQDDAAKADGGGYAKREKPGGSIDMLPL